MNLRGYMARHGLSSAQMAARLTDALDTLGRQEDEPIVDGVMVARWLRGAVGPSVRHAAAIFLATDGQVTPVDLYNALKRKGRRQHE